MAYRFEPDEPLADGCRRIAREEIDGALAALAWPDPDAAVHTVRKALKKLRALVRLVQHRFDGAAARKNAYRDAARTIGHLRDEKVLADAATLLAEAGMERVQAALAAPDDRAERARRALAQLDGPLLEFRTDAAGWELGDLSLQDLLPGVERAWNRGRARMAEARAEPTGARLHEWRKRAKDLWYHARLMLPGDDETGHPYAADLDRLSDLLGTEHDLAVLSARLQGDDGLDAARDWIADRRRAVQQEAFEIGARVYAHDDFVAWFTAESFL